MRPNAQEVAFAYDSAGNLMSITPPGRSAHTFAHSAVDLDTVYLPPLASEPMPTRYAYSQDRELTQVLRPDSEVITFSYDTLSGWLQNVTTSRGTFSYGYEPTTGRLLRITTPEADTLEFRYDGALVTRESWEGTVAGSISFSYDSDFRVSSLVVNDADTTQFQYDGDGLLVTAGRLAVTRDAATGLVTGTTLDSVVTRRHYNDFGELVADTAFYGPTALYATTLVRDSAGRIRQRLGTMDGVTANNVYTYDEIGRLVEVTKDAVLETYEYDPNGNRTRFTGQSGTVTGTYDAQDRLLGYGSASYTYTEEGELEQKVVGVDTTGYTYDAFGNLLSVEFPGDTLIEYLIDGRNRRVGKKVNGILVQGFLYQDQLNPVAELDGTGQVVARFVYASKANVPDYMIKDGVTFAILSDNLGSVRFVLNAQTGQLVQRLDYDSFGRVTANTNPAFQPFGFAGGLYDDQTGLVRFGFRDYDPEIGRWTAKDPIGFAGGLNLYEYVHSSPVDWVDPSGLQDSASPWQVGWEWLTGIGPVRHDFRDGDPFTELLRQHPHIRQLIQRAASCELSASGRSDYQLRGLQGVPKYIRDYSTLLTAGKTGNLAVTYLGSFRLEYTIEGGVLNIHAWNESTIASAFRPPVIGYEDWWGSHIARPLNRFFGNGPMSPTFQDFKFSETTGVNCDCPDAR